MVLPVHFPQLSRYHSLRLLQKRCRLYHSKHGSAYGHRPNLPEVVTDKTGDGTAIKSNRATAPNFFRLVENFRTHGHRVANLNPLSTAGEADTNSNPAPEISLDRYSNLEQFNPEGLVYWKTLENRNAVTPTEGIDLLQKTYTSTAGFEFMHIEVHKKNTHNNLNYEKGIWK